MVTALEARGVSFSYGEKPVLENLNLCLRGGELLCLLGPNGAGKTTLFRCILGLEKYSGSIAINGEDIAGLGPAALAKKAAYVPQTNYPSFDYSVFDMVLMGTAAHNRAWSSPGPAQREAAHGALVQAGIQHLAERGFRSLSGGEQQLCLIARAIAQQAGIFVMDEPAANLDYGNQFRVLEMLKTLCANGRSIIMSTHNPGHALHFADRVAALHQRGICAEGPAAAVLTAELIERLYGVCPRLGMPQ